MFARNTINIKYPFFSSDDDFTQTRRWLVDLGDPEEHFDDDDCDGDEVNETRCATKDVTMILMIFIEREQIEIA